MPRHGQPMQHPSRRNYLGGCFFCGLLLLPTLALAAEPNTSLKVDSPVAVAQLDKVSVTASLAPEDPHLAPASVSILSRTELEQRNANTLLNAVEGTPGVTFTQAGGVGRQSISLRGMESRHVLMLMDGRRIPASDDVFGHADYQYGWLPMSSIARIEIVRGPMSTLYGSDALGGVINLITHEPTDKWEGDLLLRGARQTQQVGHPQAGTAAFQIAGKLNHGVGVRLTGQTDHQNKTPSGSNPRLSELEGRDANLGSLALWLHPNAQQTIELHYSAGVEDRFYDAFNPIGARYFENRYHLKRTDLGLTWKGEFTEWTAKAQAYRNRIHVENQRTHGEPPTKPQALTEDVVDAHASSQFGSHWVTLGTELRRETLDSMELAGGHRAANHQALLMQDEVSLADPLVLTVGARQDHQSHYGDATSPRAYLVWAATSRLSIKGGYGRSFRAPTLKQSSPTYTNVPSPGYTFIGNANIKPEKSASWELGADWRSETLEANVTLFRSRVKDLITNRLIAFTFPPPRFTFQFDNVDKASIDGIEAGLHWHITRQLLWTGSGTWLNTEDLSTQRALLYRPRSTLFTSVDWNWTDAVSLRLHATRTGHQRAETQTAPRRIVTLPDYTLWGASLAHQFSPSLTLRTGMDNLGNVSLARKSPAFRDAVRGRTVFLSAEASF